VITNATELSELLQKLHRHDRVAIDTEADSLHSYFEKLCLLQLSVDDQSFLIDPLSGVDLAPLAFALGKKEIVLQGADFDLRLMRRSFGFVAARVFDTVIAARLLGIREFSLAALVKRFLDVQLVKSSQKANWGQRPLPQKMALYAVNDVRYLSPLANQLEKDLVTCGRFGWFRQSCERAIEQAGVQREREEDAWRISGSGLLKGQAAAVLRALWQWRDREARAADRPPFYILQNHQLIAATERFMAGENPEYRHFSTRRRREFRDVARHALQLPEKEWPVKQRRVGVRPTPEMEQRVSELRRRRDHAAADLGLEPSFVAPRSTLETIAADEKAGAALLVPWQRALLGLCD